MTGFFCPTLPRSLSSDGLSGFIDSQYLALRSNPDHRVKPVSHAAILLQERSGCRRRSPKTGFTSDQWTLETRAIEIAEVGKIRSRQSVCPRSTNRGAVTGGARDCRGGVEERARGPGGTRFPSRRHPLQRAGRVEVPFFSFCCSLRRFHQSRQIVCTCHFVFFLYFYRIVAPT